jgi:hypothetical protein
MFDLSRILRIRYKEYLDEALMASLSTATRRNRDLKYTSTATRRNRDLKYTTFVSGG